MGRKILIAALLAAPLFAQAPEVSSRDVDMPASFRTKVSLVLVPVVVRDKKGQPVGTLRREDFELFDKGKPQAIGKFSIEKAGSQHVEFEPESAGDLLPPSAESLSVAKGPADIAERYTILHFDDMHLSNADLMYVRKAAETLLADGILKTERVAIYTTSGRISQPLTSDVDEVVKAMRRVMSAGRLAEKNATCPPMSFYQAVELDRCQNDVICPARDVGVGDALVCANLDPIRMGAIALSMALSAGKQVLSIGETENRATLLNIRSIVRGLAAMPGQRNLVLVSPGFYVPGFHNELNEIINFAIHSRVTVNAIDARGLSTAGTVPDASERVANPKTIGLKAQFQRFESDASIQLLQELAEGTGGTATVQNNDLTGGFRKITTTPEYVYILGFSPQNLKYDGSFHALKVKLHGPAHLSLMARRGYFAPQHLADPVEEEKREIEEAMFSREVLRDLPVELHSQYFKSGEFDAKLTVLARVNLAALPFRKADGRNLNELTLVVALFDKDGNLVKGSKKMVELKLKDETLADKARSIVTFKTTFDARIGGYVIRLVVRDSEGQLMSTQNGSVVIP